MLIEKDLNYNVKTVPKNFEFLWQNSTILIFEMLNEENMNFCAKIELND